MIKINKNVFENVDRLIFNTFLNYIFSVSYFIKFAHKCKKKLIF